MLTTTVQKKKQPGRKKMKPSEKRQTFTCRLHPKVLEILKKKKKKGLYIESLVLFDNQ